MGRVIASLLAALVILGATFYFLPRGGESAEPSAEDFTPDATPDPENVYEEDVEADALEARLMEHCRKHADVLIEARGIEVADEVGAFIRDDLGVDKGIELCMGLEGKPQGEVVATLEALIR